MLLIFYSIRPKFFKKDAQTPNDFFLKDKICSLRAYYCFAHPSLARALCNQLQRWIAKEVFK